MREHPFFSVTVLAYQVAPYLEKCLDSILAQSFQNFEILLVNPYSLDGTDAICQKYADKYCCIRVLHIQNKGQLLNRIAGFQESRGIYLLTIDGDDWWEPVLLENVYREVHNEEFDLVFWEAQLVRQEKKQQLSQAFSGRKIFEGEQKKLLYEKLISGKMLNEMWRKAMHRKLFAGIRRDFSDCDGIRKGEDLLYSLYVFSESKRSVYLPLALYNYRFREDSINHRFRPEDLDDTAKIRVCVEEHMKIWGMAQEPYYRMFYRSAAHYYADFICNCCIAELPYSVKCQVFRKIRRDSFYRRSIGFRDWEKLKPHRRIFLLLFETGNILPELYGRVFRKIKRGTEKCMQQKRQ